MKIRKWPRSSKWYFYVTRHRPAVAWVMQWSIAHISPERESQIHSNSAAFLSVLWKKKKTTTRTAEQICWWSFSNKPCSYLESSVMTTLWAGRQHPEQTAAVSSCLCCWLYFSGRGLMRPRATTGMFLLTAPCSRDDCESTLSASYLKHTAVKKKNPVLMFWFSSLSLYESQSHIPELETPLSERVRAFLDWLQDNRAFSSIIHVVK